MFKKLLRYQFAGYVLVAAGLHGLFLLLPVRSINEPPPISEQPVKVVKLAKPQLPKLVIKPRSAAPLKVAPKPKPSLPRVTMKRIATPLPSLPVKPLQPTATAKAEVSDRKPTLEAQPKPVTKPPQLQQPEQPKQELEKQPVDPLVVAATDLANVGAAINAQQVCSDAKATCWQVEDSQWRSVSANLTQELEQKGYQVSPVDDGEDDTGMKIFEVSKNSKTYYLYFLSLNAGMGGTAYFQASTKDLSLEQAEKKVQQRAT